MESSHQSIAAVYARVSTDKQGESVEHQVMLCKGYADNRNWIIKDTLIYEDEDVSATKITLWERPEMKRLLADAEQGKFHIVMFKGISRFARNTLEALETLDRLKAKGLRIVSLEENYDSSAENSNFMFTMHAAISEYEAEKIGIRVRLGNMQKAKKGEWCGQTPDGYQIGEDKKLVPDEERRKLIEQIFEMFVDQNMSMVAIMKTLNEQGIRTRQGSLWTVTTLRRILRNSAYIGEVIYNQRKTIVKKVEDSESKLLRKKQTKKDNPEKDWIVVPNAHTPIIDLEQFNKAQAKLDSYEKRKDFPNTKHPLSGGIAICGNCGSSLFLQKRDAYKKKKVHRYYVCSRKVRYGWSICNQKNIRADDLEKYVLLHLHSRLQRIRDDESFWTTHSILQKNRSDLETQIRSLEKQIEKCNLKFKKLFDQQFEMEEEQYEYLRRSLTDEFKQLKKSKDELELQLASYEDKQTDHAIFRHVLEDFFRTDLSDQEQIRRVFETFVRRVTLTNSEQAHEIVIEYHFSLPI